MESKRSHKVNCVRENRGTPDAPYAMQHYATERESGKEGKVWLHPAIRKVERMNMNM
jgi:hypothetical protein